MFRFGNKKALSQGLQCKINLLVPGEELEISYTNASTGQDLLNDVARQLELLDKDYYGLKMHDQIEWLDMSKSVAKQIKCMDEPIFDLRFKYYPAEPALLANESTRYYLYLQLRLDLIEGRLSGDSQDTLAYLIACVLQSELGDYTPVVKQENYVAEFKFVPNQTDELECAAIRLHQSEDFIGLEAADSELNFLKKASCLDTYGIDPYPVKEGSSHNHYLIGVNHKGILTLQDSKRSNLFVWAEIERIALDNKLVLIYCTKEERKGDKVVRSRPLFAFRCPTQTYAHNFWKIATEHRYFFTLDKSPDTPIVTNTGGLFKKSHKLKYTGRVNADLLRDNSDAENNAQNKRQNSVKRSHSLMSKTTQDGPRWQGFQQGQNVQSSLNNLYASDFANKTMPSNSGYFREEDEDRLAAGNMDDSAGDHQASNSSGGVHNSAAARHSQASLIRGDSTGKGNSKHAMGGAAFTRRTVLTSKQDAATLSSIRRGSQIYMDTEQQTNDFVRTSIFFGLLIVAFFVTMLLINDTDRPNSVSLVVRKLRLEPLSLALRRSYYLPLKSALRDTFSQAFSVLNTRIY